MEVTGCEEQVAALAARLKGDPTAAALAGELTEMAELEAADVDPESGEEVDPEEEVDPGAEVDEPGAVAAWVALDAAPPHPATVSATSNERGRKIFFKVTSDPFVEVSRAEAVESVFSACNGHRQQLLLPGPHLSVQRRKFRRLIRAAFCGVARCRSHDSPSRQRPNGTAGCE